uniref:Uncharacterized protein n=1 Tax=Ditylenchus dipsaci TaxID=166011 RepID=A0A915CTT0_9BILA
MTGMICATQHSGVLDSVSGMIKCSLAAEVSVDHFPPGEMLQLVPGWPPVTIYRPAFQDDAFLCLELALDLM